MKVLYDKVLIKCDPKQETAGSLGLIYIPEKLQKEMCWGTVATHGGGKLLSNGDRQPFEVKKGDRVFFDKFSGQEIFLNKERHLIIRESEIMIVEQ